jgi:ubiquinone/menaquinone biosynthesis C-methylase UbiE
MLVCPKTGNSLRFNDEDSIVRVENSDVTYPVIDGIVDFRYEEQDSISTSYDAIAPRYDSYITSSNVFMKVCNTIVWGLGDDLTSVDMVISFLPSQFDGVLLDVPVGTGVFTASVYAKFPHATIIALDSSMGMLQQAKKRFEDEGIENVHLLRADIVNLPVGDAVADIVLSMNGLHVFADKQRAIAEMRRVLRKQGTLIACGYASGVRRLSDWFVNHFGVRRGFFTPPFFRADDIGSQLEGFAVTRQGNVKSLIYFEAVKEGNET